MEEKKKEGGTYFIDDYEGDISPYSKKNLWRRSEFDFTQTKSIPNHNSISNHSRWKFHKINFLNVENSSTSLYKMQISFITHPPVD